MYDVIRKMRKHWDFGLGRTALAAVCAHSVSISIGICQGYSAILIPQLTASQDIDVDHEQSSWIASFGAITNPLGAVLSGVLAEWLGRKRSIQISSFPFLIGWICIGVADDIVWLYAGRLITGIAAGMSAACYTYVTEISTPRTRGIFQALGPVSASFGILLTYTLGYFVRWNVLAYASTVFAVFTLVTVHFLPESPSHLLKVGRQRESLESLMWFRRSNAAAQEEFHKAVKAMDAFESSRLNSSGWRPYFSAGTLRPFCVLMILFLLQELSGIYTVLFYAVNFFRDSDVEVDEYVSSIIVGVIRFVMSIFGAVLINKFGRRTLCVASSAGMAISMLVVVAYFKYFDLTGRERILTLLPLICVLANVLFSMIGMLPIPWILIGELFPTRVRSIMSGVVICVAQVFIFASVKVYPDMIAHLDFSGTCLVFLIASSVTVVFCKFCLPETKNKSLEEIEGDFKKRETEEGGVDNEAFDEKPEIATGFGKPYTISVT